jgi:hypothetical protein
LSTLQQSFPHEPKWHEKCVAHTLRVETWSATLR